MSLAQRSVRSSTYTISASVVNTIVQFGRSILLARMLSPDDFGVYQFAFSFVIFTKAIPIFGLGGALVHRSPESEGEEAYRNHFTLTAIFTAGWAAILATVGYFFSNPENRWIIWTILATQVIDNLVQTGHAILAKKVQFRRVATIQVLSTMIGTATALFLAWRGFGVVSLVSTDIVEAVIPFAGFYLIRPIWKISFGLQKDVASYFIRFGKKAFMAGLLQDMLDNLDNLWTRIFLGKTALGYYSRAYTFATYPRRVLAMPMAWVSTGIYAELKDRHQELSQAFERVNALLIRSTFAFAGLLALLAPEFIELVIGTKWLPMLTAFRLMLVFTLLDPLKITIGGLFTAIGKPEIIVRIRLIQLMVVLLGLMLLSQRYGINGVAVAVNLMVISGIVLMLLQAKKHVHFSTRRLFGVPVLALGAGLLCAYFAALLPSVPGSAWRTGSVKTVVFSLVFGIILFVFERRYLKMMIEMIRLALPERYRLPFTRHKTDKTV